ncbi:MarR family transcriptional regulator [Clostridium estertheticum]|uniref:MarR family transcriptional regulator n=1 Tax=Clostridium estertheticum TaxID=238834 RepID=A0AA47EGM6_9CLOT|nr:MarR family transcriptional regulator [Clostridium estertheticum]MBU3155722.1 MarR family transcriptional regulator [Clostridium estertheticum]MBU3201193.1 MarR family transcriptional regulator [Clostridium estertheticum]WAG59074.1 MarR family transcriptional regulator [Clostridium estertheticum]WAG66875.1 MarR family transcriptional regulator [Clostridium estertheticum]
MNNKEHQKLILNMVNFYSIFNIEFIDLIPDLSNLGVSPLLSKILNTIHMEGNTTPSFLSKKLNISSSNVSRSINTLNLMGYINKRQDSIDKRITYLSLSKNAVELVSKTMSNSEEMFLKKFNVLSSEEIEELSYSFITIQNLLIKMRDLNISNQNK